MSPAVPIRTPGAHPGSRRASAGGMGGRARGCETRYGAVPFRGGRDAVNERPRRDARHTPAMQMKLASVSGPGPGRDHTQQEVRLVSRRRPFILWEKAANGWLALIQTETRARHEQQQDRARVARLRRWSTRLRSAQPRTVSSVGTMYPSTSQHKQLGAGNRGTAQLLLCLLSRLPRRPQLANICASLPAFVSTWS